MNYFKLILYILLFCWIVATSLLVANASSGYFLMAENPYINLGYCLLLMSTGGVLAGYAVNDLWGDKK